MSGAPGRPVVDTMPASNPLLVVWRRRLLFLMVFATVLASVGVLLVVLPVRYLASGSIIVAEPETGLSLPPAGWAQKVGDPADLESQLLVVRSTRILRLVMDTPGVVDMVQMECRRSFRIPLITTGTCGDLKAGAPELLDYLQTRYTFGGAGRSRVITISYTSSNPDIARDMANALITVFLEDHRRALTSSRAIAARGIAEDMVRLDAEIRTADTAVQDYRSRKGLMSGATASLTSERLTSISQQLSIAEASRDSAAAVLAIAKSGGDVAVLPSVLESRAVADIKQRLTTASEEANAAAIVLGPRHPRLKSLQGQVRGLQRNLSNEIDNVVLSAQKQLDAAQDTTAALRAQLEAAKADVSVATIDEGSIEQMVRDANVKRLQYAELYEKRKTLESEERAVLGSTRLVSLAERPLKRFFPKTLPFAAGGTVLALMAATGAALLRDRWSGWHANENPEMTREAEVSVLARLPAVGSGLDEDFALYLQAADASAAMQSTLQALYAGIMASGKSHRHRSILMLSAFPCQGKTFSAMALARFAARVGTHVLVVEGNMRAPFLEAALDLRPVADLQDILLGNAHPELAVMQGDVPRLDIIVARRTEDDPTELLLGQGMSDLMNWAKVYDLLLFDSPSLDSTMDAGLLARRVDGVVICAREDRTDHQAVSMVARRLANLGARIIGVVYTQDHVLEGHKQMAMNRRRG